MSLDKSEVTESAIPSKNVGDRLAEHDNVVVVSEPDEQVKAVVVEKDFQTLHHISRVLDTYNLEVEKKMWVDEGEKIFLQPRS